ncbi:MAG: hypothetical protein QM733_15025 [Ilumatobacteraceae bacterium]
MRVAMPINVSPATIVYVPPLDGACARGAAPAVGTIGTTAMLHAPVASSAVHSNFDLVRIVCSW